VEPWVLFWRAGPYGPNSAGILGNTIVKGVNVGGPVTTYSPAVAQSYRQLWSQSAQVWSSAFHSLGNAVGSTLSVIGSGIVNAVSTVINTIGSLFHW
jgi:hypothetical protein